MVYATKASRALTQLIVDLGPTAFQPEDSSKAILTGEKISKGRHAKCSRPRCAISFAPIPALSGRVRLSGQFLRTKFRSVTHLRMSSETIRTVITAGAWALLVVIAYATLTQVGFVYSIYYKISPLLMRPEMRTYAHFEHVIAFAVLGALFGISYPRRTLLVCCIIFGAAAFLEIMQTLTPDRHGTVIDALEKIAGGAVGIAIARGFLHIGAGVARLPRRKLARARPRQNTTRGFTAGGSRK
jgi:VanZ family protein